MSVLSVNLSCEASLGVIPGFVYINTNDLELTIVTTSGYLNGQTINACGFLVNPIPSLYNGQPAMVMTSDKGAVYMLVSISESNINLVLPSIL